MTFTIKQLATLGGVTTRTLRYYDDLNLLKPAYINESGYRIYTQTEVDQLQTILFYRELDFSLEKISKLLSQNRPQLELLEQQRFALIKKQQRLSQLISTLDDTIAAEKGEKDMTNEEKFKHFKEQTLQEQEEKYGQESRETYGDLAVDQANTIFKNRTQEEYDYWLSLEAELLTLLKEHPNLIIPSDESEKIYHLHKEWLTLSWGNYSTTKHQGLAQLYKINPEFIDYYDKRCQSGATELLTEIISFYTQE